MAVRSRGGRSFRKGRCHRSFEQLERRDLFAGLLGQNDLQYLGAFCLPGGTYGASSFAYGGTALTFNPANNSLFVVGHDHQQAVAEISIPTIRTGALSELSTASVLQPFVDVKARVPNNTLVGNVKIGGLLVADNQLIVSAYEYYDGDASALDSHFKLSSLNLSNAEVTGLFRVGEYGGGYVGGYMATVASEWQDDLGVSYLTGQAGIAIIARTSAGPGLFGFDPAALGPTTAPVVPLVNYPFWHGGGHPDDHPLANVGTQNPLYNLTSLVGGVVFPEGTDSVLFFGRHGVGEVWYGDNGDYPNLNDPAITSKGPHAYPYVYQAWAYNANDLLAVKNGSKQPWEVQPYGVWNLDLPYAHPSRASGGVAYDPATGRIYVSELYQEGDALPVIHVYQVGAASSDITPPVISSIATSGVTTSGATVSWATSEASNTQVEYGLTTAYGSQTALNTSMVTNHSAQLSGLAAGSLYHYRVKSRDAAGNLKVSDGGTLATSAGEQEVYSYNNPPRLRPSNATNTVNVWNVSQLLSAVANLQSGMSISLGPGTYNLSGVTDALYVPPGISNWAIRGATGNRNDVVIQGAGMSGDVRFGFWIADSPGGTVADLTIDGVRDHGVIANYGAHDLLIHNVRIVDSGDQFIKSNPNGTATEGNDRGIVEYSVFEYRTTDNNNYTNGVDIHTGDGWIVRYNLFRNFLTPAGQGLTGPAVLAWNGSSHTVVEGNTFINVARGVALGFVDKPEGYDHQGGLIVNNAFFRESTLLESMDVPIYVADSPNTKIFHNTVLNQGSYENAIEYRFASSTGLQIRNNLTDAAIQSRDGATSVVSANTTNAHLTWFRNPAAGDLHLVSTAPVIDQGSELDEDILDIDGQTRDSDADVGADEYVEDLPSAFDGYGDLNLNGHLDADDLTVFVNNFGRATGATQADGDMDGNGTVDGEDLTVFAYNWGRFVAPVATEPVGSPEVSGGGASLGVLSARSNPRSAWESRRAGTKLCCARIPSNVDPSLALAAPIVGPSNRRFESSSSQAAFGSPDVEDDALFDLLAETVILEVLTSDGSR